MLTVVALQISQLLGGTVVSTIKIADIMMRLVRYMRKEDNPVDQERTAEEIRSISVSARRPEVLTMEVRGRIW